MDGYTGYLLTIGFEVLFILTGFSLVKNTLALVIQKAEMRADKKTVVFIWVLAIIGILSQIPFFMFLRTEMQVYAFAMLSAFTMVTAWVLAGDCVFARIGDKIVFNFRKYDKGELTVIAAVKKNYYLNVQLSHENPKRSCIFKTSEVLWKDIEPLL